MSSIDLLPPENFLDRKRKEIARRHFENLPLGTKTRLEEDFQVAVDAPGSEPLIAFLRGDGVAVWEDYVKEIGRRESGRDFSPLDHSERDSFRERLQESFENAKPTVSEEAIAVSKRRVWVGLTMLIVGFTIIATTYYVIPYIGSVIYQKQQEEIEAQVGPQLKTIRDSIGKETNLNRELMRLSDALALLESFESDLSSMANLINALKPLNAAAGQASKTLTENATTLTDLNVAVQKAVQDFNSQVTPIPPKVNPKIAKPAPVPKDLLTRLSNELNASLVPESLNELLSELVDTKAELKQFQDPILQRVKVAFSDRSLDRNYWYPTDDERSAISEIRDLDFQSEQLGKKLESLADRLSKQLQTLPDAKFRLTANDQKFLGQLTKGFKQLKEAANDLGTRIGAIDAATKDLKAVLKQLEENESIKTNATEVFDKISSASLVIGQATEGYKKIASATEKIDKAATSLDDISELQAGLAYRGTAPAVIMLFAIGGMFVTFGLSSLLKWMKLWERAEELSENRNNLLLMSGLGALLIEHGIEPSSFLDKIQAASTRREDSSPSNPQFPISVTLAEIAKMFHGK